MDKKHVCQLIRACLDNALDVAVGAARTAHEAATHEENVAENKYDTRGLEASYLAAGQSRQMAETAEALQKFGALLPTRFHAADPIDMGALVELKTRREQTLYFIGPSAGGTEVVHEKKTVLVLTPQSPLGAQLMGRKQGERLKMKIGGLVEDYTITSVT